MSKTFLGTATEELVFSAERANWAKLLAKVSNSVRSVLILGSLL
ncbi:hypothetical protein SynMITS9220_02677 [Synechococcus sp. MIT S9220]|nr:hypothetical protein SynMITS9220_02677 [Synechococcus sp. MIT S9220]